MFLTVSLTNVFTILFLILMEGILSLDNALVLALVVRHLPKDAQRKALTYGIWGAFIFRFAALFLITRILEVQWIRIVGGLYLVYLGLKYFCWKQAEKPAKENKASFFRLWRVILTVELLDIVFSLDSILASVSVSQYLPIVVLGGILGIVMMRVSSSIFVKLLNWFPKLEAFAYGLIGLLGAKLVAQGMF